MREGKNGVQQIYDVYLFIVNLKTKQKNNYKEAAVEG